eukprot:CAMPEP_0185701666 /NCGR_PEP_ID=MMETSP1164-20130828/10081_1 /TAXON_ID=1104430 /ORGANISM="Chrysoreinhardia sp, Strain CCMP2950" /LENGTH=324 /DNA_ID=CAMNT_0028368761 /DNA_START=267 /DNA_END=1240 /DNA_ORIENTATION=+
MFRTASVVVVSSEDAGLSGEDSGEHRCALIESPDVNEKHGVRVHPREGRRCLRSTESRHQVETLSSVTKCFLRAIQERENGRHLVFVLRKDGTTCALCHPWPELGQHLERRTGVPSLEGCGLCGSLNQAIQGGRDPIPESSLLEAIGRVVLVVVSQDGGPPLKKRVALDVVVVVVVGALPEVSPVLVSSHGDVVQRAGEGLAARRADYYPTINEVPAPFDGQKRVAAAVDVREAGTLAAAPASAHEVLATVETNVALSAFWNVGLRLLRQGALEGHLDRDVPSERGIVRAIELVPSPRASRAGFAAEPAGLHIAGTRQKATQRR